jgi:hypothetical protein
MRDKQFNALLIKFSANLNEQNFVARVANAANISLNEILKLRHCW